MMAIPPSELKALTWWEYQGLLWNWTERHKGPEEEDPVEAPEAAFVMRRQNQIERAGIAKVLH